MRYKNINERHKLFDIKVLNYTSDGDKIDE
jgi:hypothetical protein